MAKYRKKPVEVDAFQYDGDLKGKADITFLIGR